MFTRKAFGKIIGKYLFAALILGAIGTELYAQQNQEGSLIGIGAYDQTRTTSIGGINVFGDGTSPYWIEHQVPIFINQQATASLEFQVPGLRPAEIIEAEFFYRTDGNMGFRQRSMQLINGLLKVDLEPSTITGSQLQYFVRISTLQHEQDILYPAQGMGKAGYIEVPLVIDPTAYSTNSGSTKTNYQQTEDIDVTILSPKPGIGVQMDDAFIAISLFYDPEDLEPGSFQLVLDEEDITELADTSAYYISYNPDFILEGPHDIQLNYLTQADTFLVQQWSFNVISEEEAEIEQVEEFDNPYRPNANLELSVRNQVISEDITEAYSGRFSVSGEYNLLKYSMNGYYTTQEDLRLQPQNRFGLKMQLGKWWTLDAGHIYPDMGNFTISGRRMFGVNTEVHLLWENINIELLYGEINRKVTNLYAGIAVDTVKAGGIPQDTTYTLSYDNSGRGGFARKIMGARVGLGNAKYAQLGIQAMKVEDDTSSIFNVLDYDDLLLGPSALYANLTGLDRQRLASEPDLLRIEGGSPRPKGNFVLGVDLAFALAQNKVKFKTETVASVLNEDIYGGPLNQTRAEELGFDGIDNATYDLLNQLATILIVNENISVLPIRFSNVGTDSAEVTPYFPTSILGSNTELTAQLPFNSISARYRWVGPDFVSLANSTIQKDISGFNVSDRIQLFSRQVFLNLGYEELQDNVAQTKKATTKTTSYKGSVSYYPVNQFIPKITVGYRYRTRDNGIQRFNPEVPVGFENAAVQNLRISEGDTLVSPVPRANSTINLNASITQRFRMGEGISDATISLSSLETADQVFAYGSIENRSYSVSINSQFSRVPLKTQFGYSFNETQSGNGQLDLDIQGMYFGATLFLFDARFSLNTRVAYSDNRSQSRIIEVETGDEDNPLDDYYVLSEELTINEYQTYAFVGGFEFKLTDQHSLRFDSNLISISNLDGLGDRYAQLKYLFRF